MNQIKIKDEAKVKFALGILKKSLYQGFEYELYSNILLFSIDIQGISSINERKDILFSAVSRFSRYNDHSLDSFKQAIAEEINERKQKTPQMFTVIFLLNIDRILIEKKKYFTVCGNKLYHRTHSYISKHFNLKKFVNETKLVGNHLVIKLPFDPNIFQHI
ncbi:MAG: hypothetical protein KJ880_01950, partial [Candidatus Omnitrophica bacterium]|nr:hypothetical protein [Candidatus Omnitrophota bacterium]